MRSVYVCLACGIHYLPPESMEYPSLGLRASTVHCGEPACKAAVESGRAGIPAALLGQMNAQAAEEPYKPRARRPAHGRRPAAGPQAARSRLQ